MDAPLKKILKAVTLELRHKLEGYYATDETWHPGDLELRLAAIGIRRDRESVPIDEMSLSEEDKHARKIIDAYIQMREEAGEDRAEAVADYVRESAYTWANRLLALRCMEARELIDEAILQKEAYGGRSLEHHRLAQREPELCTGDDDGRFAMLEKVFTEQAKRLPMLFDPQAPGVSLRPSPAALKQCLAWLSGTETVRSQEPAATEVFTAPDALGWAYQYWNTEEKDRVFEKVRTQKGAKIEGADIIPATQLYTESYMVQFLVQNSLGATWMGMHPESTLFEHWDYYVRDADRTPVEHKPVRELTFLDPACGSGHFLLEAFDLLYTMYEEEGELTEPEAICEAILSLNLYGIDIDARAIQIAEVVLWMKAAERAFDYEGVPTNLVAAVSSHLKGQHWEEFVAGFEKEPSVARVLRKFGESMEHIDELGSLARPNEDLKKIIGEEHAVWEEQVREKKEADYLFAEMREEALSGKLAFQEISDEEFGERLFYRARAALDTFTEQARMRGDFQDQFLGREASAGFKLLDVLGHKYDIIAANPPYMGSKNMGPVLRAFLGTRSSRSKRDLYAAFLDRALSLCGPCGRTAFITLDGWCFKKHFNGIREKVLDSSSIICIVYLGRHAFSDADPPGLPVMSVLQNSSPQEMSSIWSVRLTASREADEQAALLFAACRETSPYANQTRQRSLANIPNAGFFTWIPSEVLETLSECPKLGDKAECLAGLQTGDSPRFVRFNWEVPPNSSRWIGFASGGGICKWFGLERQSLDWRECGRHIKQHPKSCWRGTHRFLQPGFTYSESARGKLAMREMADSGFSQSGSAVFPKDDGDSAMILAVGSSRFASYCSRFLRPGRVFPVGYLALVPVPQLGVSIDTLVQAAVDTKRKLAELNLLERSFVPDRYNLPDGNLASLVTNIIEREMCLSAALHTIEGRIESEILDSFELSESVVQAIVSDTGTPVGWYPMIQQDDTSSVPHLTDDILSYHRACTELGSDDEIDRVRALLSQLYQAGPTLDSNLRVDETSNDDIDSDDEEESESLSGIPIPPETFTEELAAKTRVHPLSVVSIALPSILARDWKCETEEARIACDVLSVHTLKLLGFCLGHQPSNNQFNDLDGIIPLTNLPMASGEHEKTVAVRILSQFGSSNSDEGGTFARQFEETIGIPVARWLTHEFFQHHASQFKKRPVIWQLQSAAFTARSTPSYASLVYYHKLDGDLIRKVRKQAEDIWKSFETELRGITSTPVESRSDRQEQRRVLLDDGVGELREFDASLEQLSTSGFGPETLVPTLRQYAINDATLALKARWLKRLSSLVVDAILSEWKDAANKAEIHEDLSGWVAHAVTHLQHHCATVGIKPPNVEDVGDKPASADLAPLICKKAKEMLAGSLKCACEVWWKQFDDVVLDPLKEEIKLLKEERKEIKEHLAEEPPPEPEKVTDLNLRDKQLRDDLKPLNAKLKRLKKSAEQLRNKIEGWRSEEALEWEHWLSEQHLFDDVTSIDGKKASPTTVAEFVAQESAYIPDINDGVRVNIAPVQKAGILAADVLAAKDVDKAIADRAEWRADERRWVRQDRLPQPGWWPVTEPLEGGAKNE